LVGDVLLDYVEGGPAGGTDKETATPNGSFVPAPEETAKLIEQGRGGLGLQLANEERQTDGWWGFDDKVDVVFFAVDVGDFALAFQGQRL
jgi:hypothetical protein